MRFSKWHALGNSYLVVEAPIDEASARTLCDPGVGVGADGVLAVAVVSGGRAEVVVWNPDGSRAEFSGNGARIAAAWLSGRTGTATVTLRVGTRDIEARVSHDVVEIAVGQVEVGKTEPLAVGGEELELTPVSVGNPHAVIRYEFDASDVARLGPLVERNERFPDRTNVQLVRVVGRNEIAIGIWERGAGATSSSGSSAVAAAAAAVARGWADSPVDVRVAGGSLRVTLAEGGARLVGPVAEICRGELVV